MADILTDAERAAIRERADAATPGPWRADTKIRGDVVVWGPNGAFISNAQAEPHWLPAPDGSERQVQFDVDARDAEFIAHARTDVPALLAYVDHLRAIAIRTEQAETTIVAILEAERDEARARLDKVLALHEPARDDDAWARAGIDCAVCWNEYPCATIRAARGESV